MIDLVREALAHLLLPLYAVGGVLLAAVVMALPLVGAYRLGRRVARRRAIERTRARVAHIEGVARERLVERAAQRHAATATAIAEIENDDTPWLELEADERAHGCFYEQPPDAEHRPPHEEQPCDRPDAPPGTPEALLSALYETSRTSLPDVTTYQRPPVIAEMKATIAEILDACGLAADHPGRAGAERACLQAAVYSVRPARVGRN